MLSFSFYDCRLNLSKELIVIHIQLRFNGYVACYYRPLFSPSGIRTRMECGYGRFMGMFFSCVGSGCAC